MTSQFWDAFQNGLDYSSFLERFGTDVDRGKWSARFDALNLTDEQSGLLSSFVRQMNVLCMAGAWCGDCVRQCPILRRFELANPDVIRIRFVDRDAAPWVAKSLLLCGKPRVPQVVFMDEDGMFVGHFGDRTLAEYRQRVAMLSGAACSTGLVAADDPVDGMIVQQWSDEFERIQWMLRTSPRLRQRHGD